MAILAPKQQSTKFKLSRCCRVAPLRQTNQSSKTQSQTHTTTNLIPYGFPTTRSISRRQLSAVNVYHTYEYTPTVPCGTLAAIARAMADAIGQRAHTHVPSRYSREHPNATKKMAAVAAKGVADLLLLYGFLTTLQVALVGWYGGRTSMIYISSKSCQAVHTFKVNKVNGLRGRLKGSHTSTVCAL